MIQIKANAITFFNSNKKMPLYKALLLRKNPQFQPNQPLLLFPPPLFNALPYHPKPSNPLFYKPFHRPRKIISTFYSHHPSSPHFVAQKNIQYYIKQLCALNYYKIVSKNLCFNSTNFIVLCYNIFYN